MIDEKKLIECLAHDMSCFETKEKKVSQLYVRVDDMVRMINGQPKIGGWIPCSERLPEENEEVICCFKSGVVKALVLFNCKFHGKVYAYEKSDIIAWQPLPEAYHG